MTWQPIDKAPHIVGREVLVRNEFGMSLVAWSNSPMGEGWVSRENCEEAGWYLKSGGSLDLLEKAGWYLRSGGSWDLFDGFAPQEVCPLEYMEIEPMSREEGYYWVSCNGGAPEVWQWNVYLEEYQVWNQPGWDVPIVEDKDHTIVVLSDRLVEPGFTKPEPTLHDASPRVFKR